jgi:hypothetical protein
MKIPYLKRTAYVFPDAGAKISQAHQDRFPVLKDIFQRNVEGCSKLGGCITSISYELRMCGPSLEAAIPSLLVFCPLNSLKALKSLLTKPHIKAQYAQEEPDFHLVGFGIFFWARTMELLGGCNAVMVLPAEQDEAGLGDYAAGGLLPWGLQVATVRKPHCHSTMGCVIRANSEHFGLTTAHIFEDTEAEADEGVKLEDFDSVDDGDDDDDDDEYDLGAFREAIDNSDTAAIPRSPGTSYVYRGEGDVELVECEVHCPPREGVWVKEHPYLDWALLEMDEQDARLSTCLQHEHIQGGAFSIAQRLPSEHVDVLIITARHVEVPGRLYPIPSYIGGTKGSIMSEVWTVNVSNSGNCECIAT